jgi:hypothetical protein
LGLYLVGEGSLAAQKTAAEDCCKAKLACCTKGGSACCVAEVRLGCCQQGQKCCNENRACCAAVQACCTKGAACCSESKACCGPKGDAKLGAKAGGDCCSLAAAKAPSCCPH